MATGKCAVATISLLTGTDAGGGTGTTGAATIPAWGLRVAKAKYQKYEMQFSDISHLGFLWNLYTGSPKVFSLAHYHNCNRVS